MLLLRLSDMVIRIKIFTQISLSKRVEDNNGGKSPLSTFYESQYRLL